MSDGDRLIVLDFSGTLSMGAVHFGRPQNLARALRDSGLAQLGVDADNFWTEIINPAWPEGSTTGVGYRRLLEEKARRIAAARGVNPDSGAVRAAAARFTADYLRHSAIEPEWAPVLRRLAAREDIIVIATDHYAEFTAHIVDQLASLGLEAAPALQAKRGQVLVANSADLGVHKINPAFWAKLRDAAGLKAVGAVALVDDFGFNEQPADSYAAAEKVKARRAETEAAVKAAWPVPLSLFPFMLHHKTNLPTLVAEAEKFLSS